LRNRTDRGFTLLEVIFAVAILGIGLVTILGLEIKTIGLQRSSNRMIQATLLAQAKLTEKIMEISEQTSPTLYYEEGDFDQGPEGYHWEYTLSTTEADTLYRIDLMVTWDPEDKKNHSVRLESFVNVRSS